MTPSRFEHLVMVCQHKREADSPKGCCHSKDAPALLDRLRSEAHDAGLKGKVRITGSGCLGMCKKGASVVVFSAGKPSSECWYGAVKSEDAEELVDSHFKRGEVVERLRADFRSTPSK